MKHPILTLWGMVEYRAEILDNLDLPDGMSCDQLKNYIFMYAGDNEVRYSNPDMLSMLVHSWFSSRKKDFQYMWDAMNAEYNPIENYDRSEEYTETTTGDVDTTVHNEGKASGNLSTNNIDDFTPGRVTDMKTSAFNSSDYQPASKTAESGNEHRSINSTGENSSNTESDGLENVSTNMKKTNSGRAHGNIGITTNQQMVESELVLRQKNVYKMIALEFEDEFTITVYGKRC